MVESGFEHKKAGSSDHTPLNIILQNFTCMTYKILKYIEIKMIKSKKYLSCQKKYFSDKALIEYAKMQVVHSQ